MRSPCAPKYCVRSLSSVSDDRPPTKTLLQGNSSEREKEASAAPRWGLAAAVCAGCVRQEHCATPACPRAPAQCPTTPAPSRTRRCAAAAGHDAASAAWKKGTRAEEAVRAEGHPGVKTESNCPGSLSGTNTSLERRRPCSHLCPPQPVIRVRV